MLLLLIGLMPLPAAAANIGSFEDVSDDAWYASAVRFVSEKGLMTGVSETAFDPDGTATRAMIVTILYREAGSPKTEAKSAFQDVPDGKWYTDAVCWAAENGIVTGYSEQVFDPEGAITREQLAAILFRYAQKQGSDVSKWDELKAFKDADAVSTWAKEAVQWAVAEGLIDGVTKDTIVPGGNATRAQIAMILMRWLDKTPADKPLALVQSVDVYGVDYETKEWVLQKQITYEYENGYPVKCTVDEVGVDEHSVTTFVYTFDDNGQPLTQKRYNADGVLDQTTEYVGGRIKDIYYEQTEEGTTTRTMYQYANGDTHFTLQLISLNSKSSSPDMPGYTMEEIDSVQVTTRENGLLEKTVNVGIYANWNDGEEKEWQRFNGTYTANYDEDGILNNTSVAFRAGPPGAQNLFAVTKENGLIKEVVRSQRMDGQEEAEQRIVFTYTDVETDPIRYAAMINAHIIDATNEYYRYYWY